MYTHIKQSRKAFSKQKLIISTTSAFIAKDIGPYLDIELIQRYIPFLEAIKYFKE